jgi:protein-tyrosine phosphatase
MHFNQILPHLYVGACPTNTDDIDHLHAECGITAILNLQTDHDFDYCDLDWCQIEAHCQQAGIEVRRVPVLDSDGLDLRRNLAQCVGTLDGLLSAGRTVYLHCNFGTERSPSVAIAYLVWRQGWNLDAAIEHVTSGRSCSPILKTIVQAGSDRAAA